MACRTLALKKWRTEASPRFWEEAGIKKAMLDVLTMPDDCLVALAKSGGLLATLSQLKNSWSRGMAYLRMRMRSSCVYNQIGHH